MSKDGKPKVWRPPCSVCEGTGRLMDVPSAPPCGHCNGRGWLNLEDTLADEDLADAMGCATSLDDLVERMLRLAAEATAAAQDLERGGHPLESAARYRQALTLRCCGEALAEQLVERRKPSLMERLIESPLRLAMRMVAWRDAS